MIGITDVGMHLFLIYYCFYDALLDFRHFGHEFKIGDILFVIEVRIQTHVFHILVYERLTVVYAG